MITFKVEENVSKTLQAKLARLRDIRRPLEQVAQMLVESTRRRIKSTKTDPDGNRWEPWASSTMAARERNGTAGGGLLYETGSLWSTIRGRVQGRTAVVTSDEPYVKYLQLGTTKMPARPFMGISKQDARNTTSIMNAHIRGDK